MQSPLFSETLDRPKPFRVACVQFNPRLNERDENICALIEVVTEAAKNGARLIVTPEMVTTGYHYPSRDAIRPFVDTIPGETTRKFEQLAREHDAYIVIGMPEVDAETGIYYVAAALVGPEGVVGTYRKVHLWEAERRWAADGNLGIPVFATKLGKIAINICMDSVYPESARVAAVQGAEILTFLTNSTAQSLATLQDRACANGLYVVAANRSNTERGYHMVGASAVWSPCGEKLAETALLPSPADDIDAPTILYGEIDPRQYHNPAKTRLNERRPQLYQELLLYGGPWDSTPNTVSQEVVAAVLQYEPRLGDISGNAKKVECLIQEAAESCRQQGDRLQLVVLPELSLVGPVASWPPARLAELVAGENGRTLKQVGEWAVNYGLHIICGFIEAEGGKLFNAAAMMAPDGSLIGKYRKTHLTETEKSWATPGEQIPVFTASLGRIGLMIGYDAAFPEVPGVLSVRRADIIAAPSSWAGEFGTELQLHPQLAANPYPSGSVTCWDAIATGSQAYTLVANFTGTPQGFRGRSALYTLDPYYGLDKVMVASPDREEVMTVRFSTLKKHWWMNQEKLVLAKRTGVYQPLVFPLV